MTISIKNISITTIALLAVFALFGSAVIVKANPSFFMRSATSIGGTATTTLTYMSAGTATTTEIFDTGAGTAGSADSATLLVQFSGSSTASTLNVDLEYADATGIDCVATPVACDWYRNSLSALATTTFTQTVGARQGFTIPFASTTQGLGVVGTSSNREPVIVTIPTPTRYIRAVFTLPVGSTNGAVWKTFVGKRQAGN